MCAFCWFKECGYLSELKGHIVNSSFDNTVLRNLCKREEVRGEWRKLHYEEHRDLYVSANIFRVSKLRRMRREGHLARMTEKGNAWGDLAGIYEGRRPLGRPRRVWEKNTERWR
jgi:hypothetical protein